MIVTGLYNCFSRLKRQSLEKKLFVYFVITKEYFVIEPINQC